MSKTDYIKRKIIAADKIDSLLVLWRFKEKKVVFTNGCFDLLHLGHIDYLSKAADLGDILLVGLNTDASVSRIKGPQRPILDENARAMMLASLQFVDAVMLFDEDTPYELIKQVQPDVLVKGKDYIAEDVVGYDIVMGKGGSVETIDLVDGYSTSALIEKLRQAKP